jgi:uncharacterized membrane protein
MSNFFIEGGFAMWPILALGLLTVGTATRYMLDSEPVRLRFLFILSLALLTTMALATVLDVSMVLTHLAKVDPDERLILLAIGLKESSRPAILALGLLGLALDLVAIGAYRAGRRELKAAAG